MAGLASDALELRLEGGLGVASCVRGALLECRAHLLKCMVIRF